MIMKWSARHFNMLYQYQDKVKNCWIMGFYYSNVFRKFLVLAYIASKQIKKTDKEGWWTYFHNFQWAIKARSCLLYVYDDKHNLDNMERLY